MFVNVAEELKKARAGGYAIGAFNTSNLEITKAICAAAKKYDQFILIQTTPNAIEYAGLEQLYDIVINEINAVGLKAAVHLDHGKDLSVIERCLNIGYKSVMFDGSKLLFDDNVAMTQKVVAMANRAGASVEAEVGVIGHEEGGQLSGSSVLSAPQQVKKFVDLTGVNSIAVSIGNEHGAPKDEHLNLKLLESITTIIDIPLVIHGASGLPAGDIRAAICLGAAKFNIDTNIRRAFTQAIEKSNEKDPRQVMKAGMEEVEEVVSRCIKLFSDQI